MEEASLFYFLIMSVVLSAWILGASFFCLSKMKVQASCLLMGGALIFFRMLVMFKTFLFTWFVLFCITLKC